MAPRLGGSEPKSPETQRFPSTRRVRRRADFVRVQEGPNRRVASRFFQFLLAPSPRGAAAVVPGAGATGRSRLGLVVTRRIGGAVQRNRIKRLCREVFRRHSDWLPDGIDVLVIARAGADRLSFADVEREWSGVLDLLRRKAREALAHEADTTHVAGSRAAPRGSKS